MSVYLLEGSGYLYKWTISPAFHIQEPAYTIFTKLPSMAADIATALMMDAVVKEQDIQMVPLEKLRKALEAWKNHVPLDGGQLAAAVEEYLK